MLKHAEPILRLLLARKRATPEEFLGELRLIIAEAERQARKQGQVEGFRAGIHAANDTPAEHLLDDQGNDHKPARWTIPSVNKRKDVVREYLTAKAGMPRAPQGLIKDLARRAGVSYATLYNWVRELAPAIEEEDRAALQTANEKYAPTNGQTP